MGPGLHYRRQETPFPEGWWTGMSTQKVQGAFLNTQNILMQRCSQSSLHNNAALGRQEVFTSGLRMTSEQVWVHGEVLGKAFCPKPDSINMFHIKK